MSHRSFFVHESVPSTDSVENVVVSDDEEIDESHPALSESQGEEAQSQGLSLSGYKYNEVYISIDQIVDSDNTLPEVCERHCCQLVDSMRRIEFYFIHGIMNLYCRSAGDSTVTTPRFTVGVDQEPAVVKAGVSMVITEGCHCKHTITLLE